MQVATSVVWFRRDLRLEDNPAWSAADGSTTTALWVLDARLWEAAGPPRRHALVDHLRVLDEALARCGGRLRVEVGDPAAVVAAVAAEVGASVVHANADATPAARRRDGAAAARLRDLGVGVDWHWGTMVHRPGAVLTRSGTVSRVFTPFHKVWAATPPAPWPEGAPAEVTSVAGRGWAELAAAAAPTSWGGGEAAASARLARFLDVVDRYGEDRDRPGVAGTSRLSADLRFGVLSPRHVIDVVGTEGAGRAAFVRQLAWRDWYAHLLWELPHLRHAALRPEADEVAWRDDPAGLAAWQEGRTGFPLVDAGMRELATTGWMHNRVRMVCASFLVKDLLVDWRAGERWFRRMLVDGDVAQNVGNWQWCAGTGPDAAPYFRVFHPVTQSRRFDPEGTYVRRWVPELGGLADRDLHAPWEASPLDLAAAGVSLGEDYPWPIVDHAAARERALAAYAAARAVPDGAE